MKILVKTKSCVLKFKIQKKILVSISLIGHQSRPTVNVVFEWFGGQIIAKIGFKRVADGDGWIKQILCGADWNLLACEMILILILAKFLLN
jgi:hypothetical protein